MNSGKDHPSTRQRLLLMLLFLAPALLILAKAPVFPAHDLAWRWFSLSGIPSHMTHRVQYLLCVPLGAMIVVLFRLTLGIRVLGPFRPILIAFAFQFTGIGAGLIFFATIIGATLAFRPAVKALRLPYFGRVSIMLSAICALMVLAMFLCEWMGVRSLEGVAYFPIVVICLTAEGFAQTLAKEGFGSALWRGAMTALVAALIAWVSSIKAVGDLFLRYPELLLAQVGAIIVIGQHFDFRFLQKLNPPIKKKKRARKAKPVSQALVAAPAAEFAEAGKQAPNTAQAGMSDVRGET